MLEKTRSHTISQAWQPLQKRPWPHFPKVTRLTTHSVALLGQLRRETLARVDPGTFTGMVTATRPTEGSLAALRCPPPGDCVNEPQCSQDTEQCAAISCSVKSRRQSPDTKLSCYTLFIKLLGIHGDAESYIKKASGGGTTMECRW